MSWVQGAMLASLIFLLGPSLSNALVCHLTDPIQRDECSNVGMLHGTATPNHQSVLQQLCEAGHRHVLLKDAQPSQFQSNPAAAPRRAEQFAVINIHRDDFTDKVNWKSGEAIDMMCDDNWFVDQEEKLTNGYRWYSHGLPLWPLQNQTLTQKKKKLLGRTKLLDWPNYAIATPFYLVATEMYNSRDPVVSIEKLFAGDFAPTPRPVQREPFTSPVVFKEKVLNLYRSLFLDQAGYARKDINADLQSYPNWLQPLVKDSLQPMLESFLRTQAVPKGQPPVCPDELYVFFHQNPCAGATSTTCLLLNEFNLILKLVNCPDTRMVVGYGMKLAVVTEEIMAPKKIGQAQSVPKSHVMPQSMPESGSSPNSVSCNSCTFQTLWSLLVLLILRVSSF